MLNPYFVVDETIYFTDRVEEVFVLKAEGGTQAMQSATY